MLGQEGYHPCCGGEVYSNGHKDSCPDRPGCCGKCRFKCLIQDRLDRERKTNTTS